jgi:tetratricopeptide (TPR) repeat protein
MKRYHTGWFAAAAFVMIAAALGGCAKKGPESITWLDNMDDGKKAATEGKKPLLAYYGSDESRAAGDFEDTVFSDAAVITKLKAFVTVKIDADVDTETPKAYNVVAYPTTIIYYANGDEVTRLTGKITTDAFLKLLADVQAGTIETLKQKETRFAKTPDDLALANELATIYVNNNHPEKAKPLLEKIAAADPENKTGFVPGAMMQLGFIDLTSQQYDAALATFGGVVQKFPAAPESRKCEVYMGDCYQLMGQDEEAVAAYKAVVAKYPNTPEATDANVKVGRLTGLEETVKAFKGETAATK